MESPSRDFARTCERQKLQMYVSRSGDESIFVRIELKNPFKERTTGPVILKTPLNFIIGGRVLQFGTVFSSPDMKEPPIQISLAQRFFACGWLLRVWLSVFSLGVPLLVFWTLNLKVVFAAAWYTWLLIVGVLLLFAFAGFLVGAVLFSMLVAPLLDLRIRVNGGPFSVGDMVLVVGGKYRGRRGFVCSPGQGNSVVVEFDGDDKARFELGQQQLLRQ